MNIGWDDFGDLATIAVVVLVVLALVSRVPSLRGIIEGGGSAT